MSDGAQADQVVFFDDPRESRIGVERRALQSICNHNNSRANELSPAVSRVVTDSDQAARFETRAGSAPEDGARFLCRGDKVRVKVTPVNNAVAGHTEARALVPALQIEAVDRGRVVEITRRHEPCAAEHVLTGRGETSPTQLGSRKLGAVG